MATLNFLTKFSVAITATTALGLFASSANALSLTSSSGTWSKPVGGTNIKYQKVTTNTTNTTTQGRRSKTTTTSTTVTTVTTDATTGRITTDITTPDISSISNSSNPIGVTSTTTIENQVRWGEGKNGQSGLGFQGTSDLTFNLNQVFQIGTLTHYNNAINNGTAASKVDLGLNLNFSDLPIASQAFNFSFNIDETLNSGVCAYGSNSQGCADKITFSTPKNFNTFSIAGVDYTLQLVGFSATANSTPVTNFISQEGGSNSAFLYAKIAAVPPKRVPESSSALGVVAFGALAASSMLNQKQRVKATAKV
ncbi:MULTISPECIES: THxN family PEP-CTERM protein [unclassified Tolypothrix]|uniref:THxN family PEP-CTERM protein n=1 Tax=unclassified Tolypothrix TaxID=2649714 RepID=UPI0005EAC26E|nr:MULTISPECIES: THxN family PEP-CTERM protein [unclassified Tolypothrix]BAY88448.1 hypothetical protein NIES3275_04230 [Microchaete diplosiphon NIES-3275]EKF02177.1 PEP-CTERM putative exosortase interaction domain protein [Tolypothrix sp. PCC 7601]MBE9081137.1 THxN family PEP-CTERM protein [Tolypothrix sp. LEGE 11397]UYD29128.1 THxN family PEP-CTERM protein [Tolypothrix sp. PCC 7712]UYD34959.1 THxN family PEP-CTERM protein [Tolypothrix sp. PCC 7601]